MSINISPHPNLARIHASKDGRVFLELLGPSGFGNYIVLHVPIYEGTKKKTTKSIRLHTLIADTFHKKPKLNERIMCRHLDGNTLNNHYKNLKWGSQKENCQDTVLHNRSTLGEKNTQSKLRLEQAQEIYDRCSIGELQRNLAKEFGVNQVTISDIMNFRTWPQIKRNSKDKRKIRVRDRRNQYKPKPLPRFYFHPKRVRQRRRERAHLTRDTVHAIKVR